ncbi:MAG: P-loop NTPase family protein [Eubacteriales bacterium]
MYHNNGVDWKIFEYKFSGKEEKAFEHLAYLLFCAEHGLPIGVFRYFNQTGIETEPIEYKDQVIGFQAKYYSPTIALSSKVFELKKMIDDSKRKNTNLTKILVYINKELSESSISGKKKPKYQEEIEKHGKENGVIIEWRVKSHFEAELFSSSIPTYVRDYFFNPSSGIREFYEQLKIHTNTIIDDIENVIRYNDMTICIDRPSSEIDSFMMKDRKCLIIHGESGTGKSGIIRDFVLVQKEKSEKERYPIFMFRATDFGYGTISEFTQKFGDVSFDEFFSAFSNHVKKVIIIDAAEKVLTNNNNILRSFISQVLEKGWKIIVTIRDSYKDNFINYILKTDSLETIKIDNVSWGILNQQLLEVGIVPPSDKKLQLLICNLFYLNLYIQTNDETNINETKVQFYSKIWDIRIKGIPHCLSAQSFAREQFVSSMFQTITESNSYYYKSIQSDSLIANMLIDDTVITYDDSFGGYSFTHDVFEEMVALFIIRRKYKNSGTLIDFFSSLDISLPMRRHYRHWLLENLDENFVPKVPVIFTYIEINKIWKDETLIALMTDVEESSALEMTRNLLVQNDFALLLRAILLLNTACRILDRLFSPLSTTAELRGSRIIYRFTQPSGGGWYFIINYIAENTDRINWTEKFLRPVVEMLTTWVSSQQHGDTTRSAGKIALFLYNRSLNEKYYWDRDFKKKIFNIIACSSHEVKEENIQIINSVIKSEYIDRRVRHIDLCEYFISDITTSSVVCEAIPKSIIALCDKLWRKSEPPKENLHYNYSRDIGVESAFGLPESVHMDYYPTSAYQTPILSLLRHSPRATLKFIIEFLNDTTNQFHESDMNRKNRETDYVYIDVEDDLTIKQLCGGRLWGLYRGISAGPNLFECMLMALEKWLLEFIEQAEEKYANNLCHYLLKGSSNVCITSVITSLVTAYPEKLFDTALWLLPMKHIFNLDSQRHSQENTANWLRGLGGNQFYDSERLESNKLEFRKLTFEQIIVNYQIHFFGINEEDWSCKKIRLFKCIDKLADHVPVEDTSTRFALNRIDLRRYRPVPESQITDDDGKTFVTLVVDEEPDLTQIREQQIKETEELLKYTNISIWVKARYEKRIDEYTKYPAYENDPKHAIYEINQIIDDIKAGKNLNYLGRNTHIFGAAVLIRDFQSILEKSQIDFCSKVLTEAIPIVFSLEPKHEITDGTSAVLSSMPFLLCRCKPDSNEQNDLIVTYAIALLTDFSDSQSSCKLFSATMWESQPATAHIIFSLFIHLTSDFNKWLRTRVQEKKNVEQFVLQYKQKIEDIISSNKDLNVSDLAKQNANDLMKVAMTLDANSEAHFKLFIQIADGIFLRIFSESRHHNREERLNYQLVPAFIDWLANYIYSTSESKAVDLINLIMSKANSESYVNNLLTRILFKHDEIKDNEKFWHIWNGLFPYIKALCKKQKQYVMDTDVTYLANLNEIISTYCFAWPWWGDEQKQWVGVQYAHLGFFSMIVEEIGYMPATLYSTARFLYTIGSDFIVEGIPWLSTIIDKNTHLATRELKTITVYYLEDILINLVTKYENDIKKKDSLRKDVLIILNYLVEKGSTVGFLIREELF